MLKLNEVYCGDCLDVMKQIDDNSIDTIITDPPYFLNFMGKDWDNAKIPMSPDFGYWFAGLVDGEGCFRIHKSNGDRYSCEFSIKMRADERPIIEEIYRRMGVGRIVEEERGYDNSKPCVRYIVDNQNDCLKIAKIFFYYPLRAKKGHDFMIWYEALVEWCNLPRGNRWHGKGDRGRMPELYGEIRKGREYKDHPKPFKPEQLAHYMWAVEALRVLKPGGTALVFSGARTQHHLACALEDAGFILKDCVMWLYGSGFPKAMDISKELDKKAGAERKITGSRKAHDIRCNNLMEASQGKGRGTMEYHYTAPATEEAKKWNGWKSHGLKPAYEPILVAMKPNEGNYAENALKHGVSGLNIDGARIPLNGEEPPSGSAKRVFKSNQFTDEKIYGENKQTPEEGRFPANIILDEEAAKLLDEQSGTLKSGSDCVRTKEGSFCEHGGLGKAGDVQKTYGDSGGASRFFYCAKAGKKERDAGLEGMEEKPCGMMEDDNYPIETGSGNLRNTKRKNHHPTVKPLKLMEYLCILTKTPTGGIVLDPFAGSGTTGIACKNIKRPFILIEKEPEYVEIAQKRIVAGSDGNDYCENKQ